ncbi:hypothetical protein ACUN7V_02130 [Quadrisphaera oryzae]|uniref:hypothetical protein n=1 Tax=Quadrisphaera TaxID=317661 RepID=UPI001644C09D|nr:hypothetical protein [Quadrisphaera sp. RL12-1S]MBC3761134.1 hypothetical protein [Quadrisphaera sp. RL12-1S]
MTTDAQASTTAGDRPTALSRLVDGYLATLGATSPSTQRQRTWALRELLTWTQGTPGATPGTSSGGTGAPASPTPAAVLAPEPVRAWLDAAATADPPASLPGLRARASAVRALTQHAETTGALPVGAAAALAAVLRMPAPPLAPGPDPDPVRRLLVKAHPDARPLAVHPAVWTRFCAHVHLLALTGEREDVMATLRLADVTTHASQDDDTSSISHVGSDDLTPPVPHASSQNSHGADVTSSSSLPHIDRASGSHIDGDAVTPPLFPDASDDTSDDTSDDASGETDVVLAGAAVDAGAGWPSRLRPEGTAGSEGPGGSAALAVATHVRVQTGLSPRTWKLPEPARTALSGWLADRAVLASLLRGSDPSALWLRVRPSTDLRTGALRPAGLPLSDRGLRLAFTTTLGVLALEDRDLEDLSTAAVRAYARGRGPV